MTADAAEDQPGNRHPKAAHLAPYRWQPGQSGNPGGRPKGRSLTALLREVLDGDEVGGRPLPPGYTVGRALIESMVGHAMNGDASLAREILVRVEGKPADTDEFAQLSDAELIARVTAALGRDGAAGPDPAGRPAGPGDGPDAAPLVP